MIQREDIKKINKVLVPVWYHDRLPWAIALDDSVLMQNKLWHENVILKTGW